MLGDLLDKKELDEMKEDDTDENWLEDELKEGESIN